MPVLFEPVEPAGEIVRHIAEVPHAVVAVPRRYLRERVAAFRIIRIDEIEEAVVLVLDVVRRRRNAQRIVRIRRSGIDGNLERGVVVRCVERQRVLCADVRDRAQKLVGLIGVIVVRIERRRIDAAIRALFVRIEEETGFARGE